MTARPAFELADVFRRHGEVYIQANARHLGRIERRVIGAVAACRTAALGGHVERCDDCGLTRIAYESSFPHSGQPARAFVQSGSHGGVWVKRIGFSGASVKLQQLFRIQGLSPLP